MNLIETLNWRYAVKRMTGQKVPAAQVNQVVEAIRLTASSAGLQPYKLIVIENDDLKKKLQASSFNPQVAESSHLLVFAAYESITQKHIDDYMALIMQVRGATPESLADFKQKLSGHFTNLSKEDSFNWASRQAYIALGTGMIAAAELKLDAVPMEGFDAAQFDEALGLKAKGLRSVVILALGYRDEKTDYLMNAKKVRQPVGELVSVIA
jgi:nitroreductase / dihydropteridine reductase